SGTRTLNAVAGIATFSTLSIDKAGTGYTLTATSGTLTSATSTTFNISVGAASKLVFSTQPTTTVAGLSVSPAVQVTVQDAGGNTVTSNTASITLAIATNPGAGTLSGTVTLNAVAGVATFSNLSINKVGAGYTLVASSTGLAGATSSIFNVTPGPANKLAFSQQPTDTLATATISPAVTVTVQDSFGNTVTTSAASITMVM